ncbi:MAG: ADYC domain-containing protein, partial [Nannocystaceae bacterium]
LHQLTVLAFAASLAGACDLPPEPADDADGIAPQTFRGTGGGVGSGGIGLNTNWLGDTAISEFDTNGDKHGGVILHKVVLAGHSVDDLFVDEDVLRGKRGGVPLKGADFIGSQWIFELTEGPHAGEMATLSMNNVRRVNDEEGRLLYTFGDVTFNDGVPTCEADDDGNYDAALYGDLTVDADTAVVSARPHTIYIGCLSGALGKASHGWGYWPYEIGMRRFTSVIRAIRADFCGDGGSWTTPGQILQRVDKFGVSPSFADASLPNEGVWNEDGAVCIGEYTRLGEFWENVLCDGNPIEPCHTDAEGNDAFSTSGELWTKLF